VKRETPPGGNPAARSGRGGWASGFDGICTRALLGFRGCDREPELLAHSPGQESAHAMRLPASRFHQLSQGRSIGPLQQIEDGSGLTAVTGSTGLFRGLGRFLRRAGLLLGRLPLLGRNVRAVCADVGLFAAFGFSVGAFAVVSSVIVVIVISFGGVSAIS